MPSVDLEKKPFLTDQQEAQLKDIESLAAFASSADSSTDLSTHLDNISTKLKSSGNRIINDLGVNKLEMMSIKEPSNDEQLELLLQLTAVNELGVSSLYDFMTLAGSVAVGACLASGEDMEAIHGLEYTNSNISQRARKDGGALVYAANVICYPYFNAGKKDTLIMQAKKTHEGNPRMQSFFDDQEIQALLGLQNKFSEFSRSLGGITNPSSNIYINVAKALRIKMSRKFKPQPDPINLPEGTLKNLAESLSEILSHETPDYSEEEIVTATRITNKLRKYVLSAANSSTEIATDPRTRYFIFLSGQIKGQEFKKEKQALERRITKFSEK